VWSVKPAAFVVQRRSQDIGIGISQGEPSRFARLLRSRLGRLTAKSERRTLEDERSALNAKRFSLA
jgi:hypothetical protein